MTDLTGTLVAGTYRVLAKIAEGGMGTVYRGLDEKLERPVALKVIRPELSVTPEFAERFAREAKAMASLQHPSLVLVYAFGEEAGICYMVLELVEGKPLHEVIAETTVLPCARAVAITAQILDALAAIHERGIVHRDLKPPNVMVATRNGRDHVKVLDFGLAKLRQSNGLTDPNVLLGTPTYMAPEQARGDPIDGRADLYAATIVLYEMLTGAPPFTGKKVLELLEKQARVAPEPPSTRRAGIPPLLEAIIMKGLAKKPAERFQSAAELAEALRALALVAEPAEKVAVVKRPEGRPVAGLVTPIMPVFDR